MVEAYAHDLLGAYRAVRLWIAPSRFVIEKACEHGVSRDRLRLLPHGVEEAPVEPAAAAPDLPPRPFVLFAGRISVEKGVRVLPGLADRLAPVPLVVAGDGPLRGWLEREAASRPGLRLLGHLDATGLAAAQRAAAVVIVPSIFFETFCYAAAEALLDRRTVVASRIGAIPELVEDGVTGLLVPPGDPGALGQAVRRALEDPAARAWAEAGRARVVERGDRGRHVDGLLAIYREAMGSQGG
jgi:glycosyltransferase involved in cell wall biosynthesis